MYSCLEKLEVDYSQCNNGINDLKKPLLFGIGEIISHINSNWNDLRIWTILLKKLSFKISKNRIKVKITGTRTK
jgi:hypothetical protein